MKRVHIKAHEHDLAFTDYRDVFCMDADCDFVLSESSIIVVLKDVCRIDKNATWSMPDALLCNVCESASVFAGNLCVGCLAAREAR